MRCAAIPIIKAVANADLNDSTQEFLMKRLDCLKLLAPMVDEHMLTVTSLSSNTAFWSDLRREGANFFGCNMGLCIPFALGLTAAFPKRKVIALDSDGSLMVDTSSLITVADVNPPNFVAIVMDNGSYARMGSYGLDIYDGPNRSGKNQLGIRHRQHRYSSQWSIAVR